MQSAIDDANLRGIFLKGQKTMDGRRYQIVGCKTLIAQLERDPTTAGRFSGSHW